MLTVNKTQSKKTATNKVGSMELTYTFEEDEGGVVQSLQINSDAASPHRLSVHYDVASNGLHIGINNFDANFDPQVLTTIIKDTLAILKKPVIEK